eukprot:TRINITY_DN5271_c1_g1_i2.p5 TRINITY_DN5271_c1_g1~~TRINITY_DN5271_c1_g1_i2.p5  ORF type:complete len:125 (-),score=3.54 TRINITY_DN5271_c1_g1_i2:14-388(-)
MYIYENPFVTKQNFFAQPFFRKEQSSFQSTDNTKIGSRTKDIVENNKIQLENNLQNEIIYQFTFSYSDVIDIKEFISVKLNFNKPTQNIKQHQTNTKQEQQCAVDSQQFEFLGTYQISSKNLNY